MRAVFFFKPLAKEKQSECVVVGGSPIHLPRDRQRDAIDAWSVEHDRPRVTIWILISQLLILPPFSFSSRSRFFQSQTFQSLTKYIQKDINIYNM